MINIYTPENRIGWWGGRDERVRCIKHDKVAFETLDIAQEKALKIQTRGENMTAYKGKCGNYHVGHKKGRF